MEGFNEKIQRLHQENFRLKEIVDNFRYQITILAGSLKRSEDNLLDSKERMDDIIKRFDKLSDFQKK